LVSANISAHSPAMAVAAARKKQSMIEHPTVHIYMNMNMNMNMNNNTNMNTNMKINMNMEYVVCEHVP
jgi:hypothetical protein